MGQRVSKATAGGTTLFAYDEWGHLIGEYTGGGALIEETVWLGDIPVAILEPNGTSGVNIYYVHTDHLNTPRRVTAPSGNVVVWRWDSDPFGAAAPDEDPDGNGQLFVYNLRFPGQYYDSETGLNYNYRRDYDPQTGRYLESDPIGLAGRSYSTYAYVRGNPISRSDPQGLYDCTYSITAHSMSCSPNQAGDPSFSSNNFVSGNNGAQTCHNNCQNNPNMTSVSNHGPIPVGTYTIGGITLPFGSRRNLAPSPDNQMFGRWGFQLHGCPNPATCSDGCVAATTNADRDLLNQDLSLEEGHNTLTVVP
jgi:RHS repeat-associated protein